MNTIVKMKFGSALHGTLTPNSDTDYKGVFIPSIQDVLLGRIKKSISRNTGNDHSKNASNDVDHELYSLHYFVKLACEGQTVALDMLHAPLDFVEHYDETWKFLVDNRHRFYTKNLNAFVGYARRQAAKYGIKGSRLGAMGQFLLIIETYLNSFNDCAVNMVLMKGKTSTIWNKLPITDHSSFIEDDPNGNKQYQICGTILQGNSTIQYNYDIVTRMYKKYGERAKQAERNEGIDFKAVSHALRAAYQVKELLVDGTITFPRPEADFLRNVKQGKLHYKNKVAPILESLMEEVEVLSASSNLPEKVDTDFWDDFIVKVCLEKIKNVT
jgi:hypothetical protein